MKTTFAKKIAIAISAFACAAMFSFGWSEQGGISLSIHKAQAATRLVVRPYYHGHYGYYYHGPYVPDSLGLHLVRSACLLRGWALDLWLRRLA